MQRGKTGLSEMIKTEGRDGNTHNTILFIPELENHNGVTPSLFVYV